MMARGAWRWCRGLALAAAGVVAWTTAAHAFALLPPPTGRLAFSLNLGDDPIQTSGYGLVSFNALVENALYRWNNVGVGPVPDFLFFSRQLPPQSGDPCLALQNTSDQINEIRFSTKLCGFDWGSIIGVMIPSTDVNGVDHVDILFNPILRDAYPGPQHAFGPYVDVDQLDFYRVAIHEIGHAVGLDHPDQAGQTVTSVMNSVISDTDDIQPDDVAGAHAVQWFPPDSGGTPPGGARLAGGSIGRLQNFVAGMYTAVLGRSGTPNEISSWVAPLVTSSSPGTVAGSLVHGFFDSAEFLARPTTITAYVDTLYLGVLDRTPSPGESAVWFGPVLASYNELLPGFTNSAEFQARVTNLSPAAAGAMIQTFYEIFLGREPAPSEVASWVDAVTRTGNWPGVVQGFTNSTEYLATPRSVYTHVTNLYRALLGRSPSAQETAAWVSVLVSNLDPIADAFVTSAEFATKLGVNRSFR